MTHALWPRFRDAIADLDARAVRALVIEAQRHSTSVHVMDELIGPGLAWIGEQWMRGSYSVAREHRATHMLTDVISDLPVAHRSDANETVIVLSAEGEWHTAPCLMVAHALRIEGFDVVELDGPVAAGQLLPLLHHHGPRCVAISVVMTAHLAGARRLAAVARDVGVGVIAGGAAITAARARHVGAHATAGSIAAVADAVSMTPRVVGPLEPLHHQSAQAFEWVDLRLSELAAALGENARSADEVVDGVWMLRTLKGALMCDEPGVLAQQIAWQRRRESQNAPSADRLLELISIVTQDAPDPVERVLASASAD